MAWIVTVRSMPFIRSHLCHDVRSLGAKQLADEHQVNSIIATAICECCRAHPERTIEPEEAKQIAKCIIGSLSNAGLVIGAPPESP
jgi:hypothetical protein